MGAARQAVTRRTVRRTPPTPKPRIEVERETDGRYIAEVRGVPGVEGLLAYGATRASAIRRAVLLTLVELEDRVKRGELEEKKVPVFALAV